MKLHFTPRSHFSRKVRILLDALGVEVELVDAGDVGGSAAANFGDHPLMMVPVLEDSSVSVVDSDHIAGYLVRKLDANDTFSVLTSEVDLLNMRALMNGVMAAEVEIILARRSGLDIKGHARFDKKKASIRGGLDWLERRASMFPKRPSYAGFHLVCLWDHLMMQDFVDLNYPQLEAVVSQLSALPYVALSAPS